METMSGLTGADALSIMNSRNTGYDGYGADGGWFWIIIILVFLGNGNGFGNNNKNVTEQFIERDIFNTNQNVSTTGCQTQRDVLENRYTTELGFANLGAKTQECCCQTQRDVLENRFQNALQTQTLSSQMEQCCCNLRAEGLENTQKVIDLINRDKIDQLREQVSTMATAYNNLQIQNNLISTLLPRAVPAYPSCSPYVPSYFNFGGYGFNNGCGCGNNTVI